MKKCSNCGAANLDEAKFCHQCGGLIARERPMSKNDMSKEDKRPSLDDLEFVETDLTNESPKTLRMKDKVSLRSTEETQVSSTRDQPSIQSKHKKMSEVRQTVRQEEPAFVGSLDSAPKTTRLADTGDVFIADVLANIETDIDLDADIVDWHSEDADPVDPESLAVPVERVGRAHSAEPVTPVERPFERANRRTSQKEVDLLEDEVTKEDSVTDKQSVLQETDLVTPAPVLSEPTSSSEAPLTTEADEPTVSNDSLENRKPSNKKQARQTKQHEENPMFKREPVYLKPETYGPSAREAQRKLDAELAAVVSTIECPHCGHQNPDYYSFCQVCKKKLYAYEDQIIDTQTESTAGTSTFTSPSENDAVDDALFVPAYINSESTLEETTKNKRKKKKKHRKERKRGYGWLITLLLLVLLIAGGVFAYFYFFKGETANAVYQEYSEAIVAQDYDKAASLTASTNGHAWTGDDVERMIANYAQAQVDLSTLLAENPEATELVQGNHLILEVDSEPSFLGLFPEYQVFVHAINVALSVPNDYRDIAITTFSHQAQPITAGDAVILEPRENYIIVRLTENDETREIGLDLNYSLMADGTLPISLKEVENRIQADLTTLPGAYPQEFTATGFVIDGQEYTADIITLNGYVGQSFTVSIRGEYFGEAIESSQQEIHLEDDSQVLVSLADDGDLLTKLQAIEAANADMIANRTPAESAETWLQIFQNDFVDAINFRAPDMLAKYGDESEWYANTASWIQNEVVTNGIYYNTATYEIISVEPNDSGQMVLTTTELFDYTLGGVAAVQAQSKVYVLADNGGQLTILSVEVQDIAN